MANGALNFLHLSDIHFKKESGGKVYDFDLPIRSALENDAWTQVRKLGSIHGILVTGDIAFSGQRSEYEKAAEWLEILCAKVGCPIGHVWTVPGNHDVDWKYYDGSTSLQDGHEKLQHTPSHQVAAELKRRLEDPGAKSAWFLPLSNYNHFANTYEKCPISPEEPYWEHQFSLNDRTTLRLRGVTSVLVSSRNDDIEKNALPILGTFQVDPPKDDSATYMLLCHHPPRWLKDQDHIETWINSRFRIQLFGHKHEQTVDILNNSLRLIAGAMHPDRQERNWLPRYNLISISVIRKGEDRFLSIVLRPRIWDDKLKDFKPDVAKDDKTFPPIELQLPKLAANATIPLPVNGPRQTLPKDGDPGPESNQHPINDPARTLTYRFMRLPYSKRIEIMHGLDLIRDEDEEVNENERWELYFKRAKEMQVIPELWDAVENAYDKPLAVGNPFREAT